MITIRVPPGAKGNTSLWSQPKASISTEGELELCRKGSHILESARMCEDRAINRIIGLHVVAGTLVGAFFLHPVTMVIYMFEFQPDQIAVSSLGAVILHHMAIAFTPRMLPMTAVFWGIGALLGLGSGFYARALARQMLIVSHLEKEVGRTVASLIEAGEGAAVEFKSSLRWDYALNRSNKQIELEITKTVAGFLNHNGGNLLIGVADDGAVLGLEKDYGTLKRKNRDGFEQLLMRLVKDKLGADTCAMVHVMFHGFNGEDVCRVIVEPSHRPVYVQHDGGARYFLRVGNATPELNIKEALEHVKMRWPRL